MNKSRSHTIKKQIGMNRQQLADFLNVSKDTVTLWDKPATKYGKCDSWPCWAVAKCDCKINQQRR